MISQEWTLMWSAEDEETGALLETYRDHQKCLYIVRVTFGGAEMFKVFPVAQMTDEITEHDMLTAKILALELIDKMSTRPKNAIKT